MAQGMSVATATTCDPGFVIAHTEPLLLPRPWTSGYFPRSSLKGWVTASVRCFLQKLREVLKVLHSAALLFDPTQIKLWFYWIITSGLGD